MAKAWLARRGRHVAYTKDNSAPGLLPYGYEALSTGRFPLNHGRNYDRTKPKLPLRGKSPQTLAIFSSLLLSCPQA